MPSRYVTLLLLRFSKRGQVQGQDQLVCETGDKSFNIEPITKFAIIATIKSFGIVLLVTSQAVQ